jgi:hypothetical protein
MRSVDALITGTYRRSRRRKLPMMIIGWSNILFSLSISRLPKSGDEPKVQVAWGVFGISGVQATENKRRINSETL